MEIAVPLIALGGMYVISNQKNEDCTKKEIRKMTDIPLILVGGIRSLDVAQKILAEGSAHFVSLCRPLIRQPDLPKKWLKGTGESTADCISCNACLDNVAKVGVRCIQKERAEQKTAS